MPNLSSSHYIGSAANSLVLKRAHHACARCRRQKLRCDDGRPCIPCIRSQRLCEEPTLRSIAARQSHVATKFKKNGLLSEKVSAAVTDQENPPATDLSSLSWEDRPSTLRLVEQVFMTRSSQTDECSDTDALPDSGPRIPTVVDPSRSTKHVSAVLDMDLPPEHIILALYDSFLESFHWYHITFYEPTFRKRLRAVLDYQVVACGEELFLLLLLIVLITGARYWNAKQPPPVADLQHFQKTLMHTVEAKVIIAFEQGGMDSLAFLFLLASHFLMTGAPSQGFLFLGLAVRLGQSIGLYNETLWAKDDIISKEMRRRLFWSLYVADGFVAQIFGRPAIMHEIDIQVGYPGDLEDTLMSCPGFLSTEIRQDGSVRPVTIHSYARLRASLYRIAAPIGHEMYTHKKHNRSCLLNQVRVIHEQLINWKRNIPPELCLEAFAGDHPQLHPGKVVQIFQVQALALQTSYDNIQLLLHRPVLSQVGRTRHWEHVRKLNVKQLTRDTASETAPDLELDKISKSQCWESAMRISQLIDYPDAWSAASKTPLGSHVGLHAFTAGVMLGIFALSNPCSDQAQQARRGIARIIRMPSIDGYQPPPVWPQCTKILEELRLTLAEEFEIFLSDGATSATASPAPMKRWQSNHNTPLRNSDHHREISARGWSNMENELDLEDSAPLAKTNGVEMQHSGLEHPDSLPQPLNGFSMSVSPDGDFDDAFSSLQSIVFGEATSPSSSQDAHPAGILNSTVDADLSQGKINNVFPSMTHAQRSMVGYQPPTPATADFTNQTVDICSGNQMWMWKP